MLLISAGAAPAPDGMRSARASSAWLTSASAAAFCARGTERTRQRAKAASAASAARCSGFMSGCLTLYCAVDLLGDELGVVDDLDLGRRPAPARARGRAAGRGTRRRCSSPPRGSSVASSTTSPSGVESTAAGGGRARVAARAAVDVDDELHPSRRSRGNSPGTRARRRSRIVAAAGGPRSVGGEARCGARSCGGRR